MSAFDLGGVVGAALAMALFGALFAWVLRRVAPVSLAVSYAGGIAVAVVLGANVYTSGDAGASYPDALLRYGLGGVIAFPILLLTAGRRRR